MLNHRSIAIASLLIGLNFLTSGQALASQPAANNDVEPIQPAARPAGKLTGTVVSTTDATGYTYVELDASGETIWLAGPKTKLTKGDSLTVNIGAPMRNFHSKTLDRDFPVIYFVSTFSDGKSKKVALPEGHKPLNGSPGLQPPQTATLDKPVKVAEGGYTIADIIAKKTELAGKTVKVRGQITKYNADIMMKNWIHIIDGSSKQDLIIITNDTAETGKVALIEGTVVLDKDFGYGYKYKLLIDEAKVTIE
ncbi:MAG: hypothetical protein OQK32_08825 [Gammaproteobacteria bacterium]|nr:hypothetical protein [Gammaproteobacteria bacterium]MCW8923837.1 hypothetical protein [Gammaproteobacteria bacterium]